MVSGFVWIFTLLDWLFPVFLPSLEKRTVFHSSLQAENYFGQVLFKPEVLQKFCDFILLTWVLVQCLTVFWYLQLEGSTSPRMFYSVFISSWQVLLVFDVLFLKQVLYIFSTPDVAWDQCVQSPGRSGTPSNSVWYISLQRRVNLSVSKLVYSLYLMYCSCNKYCF